ncbi:phosphate acetyltransferase [Hymenobacter daecheongensis DSM 21074]|uniref:Phosphate acetyltransferase n=1 Tax=Hymenobacter daecheongensis DSM 21074 TaxID=1121955 RepID=A0A1M6M056_9BACT|nr:phosphate acetyltransferase [Hymenobacter daecheongensis]SHJ76869.1 phosphate acetyltransferase [Hymenobacter daecheongensis DSM 21074]
MSKAVFIATAEPYSGKSLLTLGLVHLLLSQAQKVGYFKPIITPLSPGQPDAHIETVLQHFQLPLAYPDTYATTGQEALHLTETGRVGELLDTIIHRFKQLEAAHDFVVVEGTDFVGTGLALELDLNWQVARNLSIPAILLISGLDKTVEQVVNMALSIRRDALDSEVQVLALVLNRVAPEQADDVRARLRDQLPPDTQLAVIPENQALRSPTMQEIYDQLGGELLFGQDQLANPVDHFINGSMQVPNFLTRLQENVLIITPGDRADLILTALQANMSANYPRVAGLVLTGGYRPEDSVLRLIEGLPVAVPIMLVENGTFQTTTRIGSIQARIGPGQAKKIRLAIQTFERHLDTARLLEQLSTFAPRGLTPHMFQYQLLQWARSQRKHIVLPEGNDDRILRAAARLLEQDVVSLTILGDPAQILAAAKRLGRPLDPQRVQLLDPARSELFQDFAETLFELRKTKGVTLEMARDLMTDVSYFGSMLVYKGLADGMVSGAVHTTQHTIRPALQFIKTKPGVSVVSSVFFMCLPDRVAVFGDCAVNPNPTAAQLAEIAISSADSSRRFGIEPRVAMLSYSSGTSGEGADVDKVREATQLVRQLRPDLLVEGPIQYDAAVDPAVGQQKLPGSPVAGQASVLIFPDLNTGNNTYKAVQRETGALAIGPMLQGLNKPVNDLSRGCTVDDIYNTVLLTAIQAQQ